MTTVTEGDLRELLDLINTRFGELDKKVDGLDKKLDVYIAKTDEQLKAIAEKVDKLDGRLEKLEDTKEKQIWTLITLLGGSLVTVAFRFFLTQNP